ncbi:hypothetical protein J2Z79_001554 [Symbiobacterium terraclitae]|uniref:Uncharacterized protein n=1 Tax=Symbiobacterium terraclitae TaxID=557451 RepID=A0ABS4JRK2_9FIRM|nr:hypothetical protein [Symbiobacterium terraclitae]
MDLAQVPLQRHGVAGLCQLPGVGLALVAQRVELGGDDERRRQVGRVRHLQRRGAPVAVVFVAVDVVVPEPLHHGRGQEIVGPVLPVRRGVEAVVGHRVDQHLVCQLRIALLPGHEGDHRGQVAAGAVAGDGDALRVAAEAAGVLGHPGGRGVAVLGRRRELVLRGHPVVHRDHHRPGAVRQQGAGRVDRVRAADHPAAAVEVEEYGERPLARRRIDADGNRTCRARNRPVHQARHRFRLAPERCQLLGHPPGLCRRHLVERGATSLGQLLQERLNLSVQRHQSPLLSPSVARRAVDTPGTRICPGKSGNSWALR